MWTEPDLDGLQDADGTGHVVEPSAGPQGGVDDIGLWDQVIADQGVHAFGFTFMSQVRPKQKQPL